MSWATITMVNDAEERAVVTASMNAIGQAISAWSQLLQFPAIEAPRFEKGFLGGLVTSVVQMLNILVIVWCASRDRKKFLRGTLGEQTNTLAVLTHEKSSAAHQAQPTTN
jgi:ACS family pantothenate transporter-like MFS transporter